IAVLDEGFAAARALLERAVNEAPGDHAWHLLKLLTLAFTQINTGQIDAALATVEKAVSHATHLGPSHLLGEALGTRAMVVFMSGAGVNDSDLRRALALEDRDANVPLIFRPSVLNALLLGYSGELDRAHDEMLEVRRRSIERGEEGDLVFLGFNNALIEI